MLAFNPSKWLGDNSLASGFLCSVPKAWGGSEGLVAWAGEGAGSQNSVQELLSGFIIIDVCIYVCRA